MTWGNLEGIREDLGVTRGDPGGTREELEGNRGDHSAKETQEDLVVFWASALTQHRPGFLELVSEEGRAAQRLGGICWAVQRKVSYKVEL